MFANEQRQPVAPYLSIDGIDVSNNLLQIKLESHDDYWYPEVYPDTEVEKSQLSKVDSLSQTWSECYVELDNKDVSDYFGKIHFKENCDPKRAWEGYELIMTTPDPFPDQWQEYIRSFPKDVPIRVLICPNGEPSRKSYFECDMYVHYREIRWKKDRPYNQGRMIMRSLATPRSLPSEG